MKPKCYRVLIVEDDESGAQALQLIIENHYGVARFDAEVVKSVMSARSILARQEFHVILLDLNLKNGTGATTFNLIKEAAGDLPIVILTADDQVCYSDIILQGADDFIHKPYTGTDLCERLHIAILRGPWKKIDHLQKSMECIIEAGRADIKKLTCPNTDPDIKLPPSGQ